MCGTVFAEKIERGFNLQFDASIKRANEYEREFQ